jgi:hypothetical protein
MRINASPVAGRSHRGETFLDVAQRSWLFEKRALRVEHDVRGWTIEMCHQRQSERRKERRRIMG